MPYVLTVQKRHKQQLRSYSDDKTCLEKNFLRRLQQTNEFNICKNDEASCRTKDNYFGSHSIILSQAEVLHRQRRLKRRAEFLRRKQQKFMLFQNIKASCLQKKYFGINSIN